MECSALVLRWDLFFHQRDKVYDLRHHQVCLSAKDLKGSWTAVEKLPKDFKKLPDTDQYQDVKRAAASPQKPKMHDIRIRR